MSNRDWIIQSTQKHKFGREHWILASCQVSSNSVLRAIEEDKLKIFGQSETRVAIFGFGLARKTQAYK